MPRTQNVRVKKTNKIPTDINHAICDRSALTLASKGSRTSSMAQNQNNPNETHLFDLQRQVLVEILIAPTHSAMHYRAQIGVLEIPVLIM